MIIIYGIKNCDTMQRAVKWLNARGLQYAFHNYKDAAIDKATIETWLKHFPADKLINTRGTTFRALAEDEKKAIADPAKAVALMMKYTSVIKRPVWDFRDGRFFLGWDEQALEQMIAGNEESARAGI